MIRKALVEGGTVCGIPAADPRITAFKGIPFAAPPTGENRWRAPQPVIPWTGELQCWNFAPISMQHIPGLNPDNIYTREWNVDPEIPMDEDCLYLNVWTPAKSAEEKLPVFVWYFGGGLVEGNPAEMEFDGERIARRGIVVVTVNYRLNAFGFLAHPELTTSQPEAPTNFGHLDQQAGTRWGQRNIAAFGGDPDNITIGGQSAGGGSVCAQLTSPQNEGLCQKAVIMSGLMGGVYPNPIFAPRSFAQSEELGQKFFEHLGVKTLAEARALDAAYIRDKTLDFPHRFAACADGVFLTEPSTQCLMTGKRLPIPLMVSRTGNEFLSALRAPDQESFLALAKECFGPDADEFLRLLGDDPSQWEERSRCSGIEAAARALAKRSEELGIDAPIYYSVFDPEIPGWDNPGTFHSSDLWFWFETLAKCWRPFTGKHYDLARLMCNYMANFIRSGDPNGCDADGSPMPEWKPLRDAEPHAMHWGDHAVPMVDTPDDLIKLQVKAWSDRY
jgi:para-nitrobenzyl esterase